MKLALGARRVWAGVQGGAPAAAESQAVTGRLLDEGEPVAGVEIHVAHDGADIARGTPLGSTAPSGVPVPEAGTPIRSPSTPGRCPTA